MAENKPKTRPMTDSEKAAYKKGLEKGLGRSTVGGQIARPSNRRYLLLTAPGLLFFLSSAALGYALFMSRQESSALVSEVASLRSELANAKSAAEVAGTGAVSQLAAANAETLRIREQHRQTIEKLNNALAAEQVARLALASQSKSRVKKSVLDGIKIPKDYTKEYISKDNIKVGLLGPLCYEESFQESELIIDKIIDETTAILRYGGYYRNRIIAANFPTDGLADEKMLSGGKKWKVVGTHREIGSTLYVLIPADKE